MQLSLVSLIVVTIGFCETIFKPTQVMVRLITLDMQVIKYVFFKVA